MGEIKNLEGNTLELSEYHSDHVAKLPKNFKCIASSDSADIEAMISEDEKMISFQSHPEYTNEYTSGYELRVQKYDKDDYLNDFSGDGEAS